VAIFCVSFLKKVQPELLPKWSVVQHQDTLETLDSRTKIMEKQV